MKKFRRMRSSLFGFLFLLLSLSPHVSAVEFSAVNVRLAEEPNASYDMLGGQRFEMRVELTIHCTWRDISTRLHFYALNEATLGHTFNRAHQPDYAAMRRSTG